MLYEVITFANLECTLEGDEKVPTEPRVLTTEIQIQSLEQSGIDCVSLGNNHAFDCYDQGFIRLREMLSRITSYNVCYTKLLRVADRKPLEGDEL